jgi:predicted aspartyl protease
MITLTHDVDQKGRPVLTLYVAPSASRIAALHASGEEPPPPVEVRALVDTGATRTVIQRSVLASLGLDPVGVERVHTASTGSEPREVGAFMVQLFIAGLRGGTLAQDLRAVEAENLSGLAVEVLLGRDVIDRFLLFLNGPEGRFTLAIPSFADQARL